jgi:hypothetical protein
VERGSSRLSFFKRTMASWAAFLKICRCSGVSMKLSSTPNGTPDSIPFLTSPNTWTRA